MKKSIEKCFFLFISLSFISVFCYCDSSDTAVVRFSLGSGNTSRASTPPREISGYTLTITGGEMKTIYKTYNASTQVISLSVPSGKKRKFILSAAVADTSNTHILTYKGETVLDLEGGRTYTATLTMAAGDTKLIIPDGYNYRVVMVDSINGENWQKVETNGYTYIKDIDYDSNGRIYMADNNSDAIARFNYVGDTSPFIYSGSDGFLSVSVDRENGYVYGGTSNTLHRFNIETGTSETLTVTDGIYNVRSLALTESNNLLITCDYYDSSSSIYDEAIILYDPINESIIDHYRDYTDYNNLYTDVIERNGYIYVLDYYNGIIKLNQDLELVATVGTISANVDSTSTADMEFFAPTRLVAVRNQKITILDDDRNSEYHDRVVSLDNFAGDGWSVYGDYGNQSDGPGSDGAGFFNFWS